MLDGPKSHVYMFIKARSTGLSDDSPDKSCSLSPPG